MQGPNDWREVSLDSYGSFLFVGQYSVNDASDASSLYFCIRRWRPVVR